MKRGVMGLILFVLAGLLAACGPPEDDPAVVQIATKMPGPLPGRATATPPPAATIFATRTPDVTPLATSPFTFPTTPPDQSPTPSRDCTTVFPLENVEAIEFNRTTVTQLEASFGQATYRGGRPVTFRFESSGCTLNVAVAGDVAQEAELLSYGTLDLLLDRYGEPAAVGIAEGNLVLVWAGSTVLLYPEEGVIAIFDAVPDALTRDSPVYSLQFRPPYDVDQQVTRLNLRPVTWEPPLR
jgi:hypothetical protein